MNYEKILHQCRKPMLVFDKKCAVKFSNLFFDQIVSMADSHELLDKTGHSINKRFADQLITKAGQNQAHVLLCK